MKLATTCNRCQLCKTRKNVVWGNGNAASPIMFVAESPGTLEDKEGEPFVDRAPAGAEMNRLLAVHGWLRSDVYVTNLVKCHPPNDRNPTQEEMDACFMWLEEEIERVDPSIIVLVGAVAMRYILLDDELTMEMEHGIPRISRIHEGRVMIPIYHPAAGLHHPETMLLVQRDMDVVKGVATNRISPVPREDEWRNATQYDLVIDPATTAADMAIAHAQGYLAVDTEWARGKPWCLSYSVSPGMARVIMAEDWRCLAEFAAATSNHHMTTVIHNALYDLPVLRQMGVEVAKPADTMVMAYLLQDEPQGLKVLAYRHCGMEMRDYTEVVGDAGRGNALAYLRQVLEHQWPKPSPITVWEKGVKRTKQPQGIERRVANILRDVESGKVTKDGPTDPYKRWMDIKRKEGRGMVEAKLGVLWEGDLSDIPLGEAVNYSARDADATIRLYPILWERIEESGMAPTFWRDMRAMPMVADMMVNGMPINPDKFSTMTDMFRDRMAEIQEQVQVGLIVEGIYIPDKVEVNPNSPVIIAPYIYDPPPQGLGVGKVPGYNAKAGTEDDILARMVGDSRIDASARTIIQHIRDYRAMKKLESSYGGALPEKADSKNRIHSTLRMTRVATGRISSSDPNLMAIPVRTAEGRMIREGFEAEPGRLFCSGDYSQVEMRVVCHDARDPVMSEIFINNLDIHSQTASRMFGIPVEDLDEMKHRYPAKRVGFGVLNDLSPEGLQREMVSGGASLDDWPVDRCGELIVEWFRVYKGIADFMKRTREHALRYGWVQDMWGRRRYIPNARSSNESIREEALRQAGNAPIQMGAQGVIKEAMGQMVEQYKASTAAGKLWLPMMQIHDDLVDEISEEHAEEIVGIKKRVMEGAVVLSVPLLVDIKVGRTWGTMVKWDKWLESKEEQ